jgi:hypothetical protein
MLEELLVESSSTALLEESQFASLLNPSSDAVREQLSNIAYDTSASNDILLFYFSGHAVPVGHHDLGLCTNESFSHPSFQTPVPSSMVLVRDIIMTASAVCSDPILIIDACYAGSAGAQMQIAFDEAHYQTRAETGSAYALLSSCRAFETAVDRQTGGLFSSLLCDVGQAGNDNVGSPRLSLQDMYPKLRERLEAESVEMTPQLYVGGIMPEFGLIKNTTFSPREETLHPYMVEFLRLLWDGGACREVTTEEIRQDMRAGIYGNHSKLSLAPWQLVEDGSEPRTRRLSDSGTAFMRGDLQVPREIACDSDGNWRPKAGSSLVGITDYSAE